GGREPRLGFAVDHFKLKTQFVGDTGEKLHTILCGAARFRRDQPGAGHALVFHFVTANGERRQRPRDCRFAQLAGCRDTFSKSDDTGKRIDDAEALARRPCHQKPTVVCAEIERCICRAASVATEASIGPPRRPPTPPGARMRRPVNSGVEARDIPGLAAHSKTFLPLRRPPFSARHGCACLFSIRKSVTASSLHATLRPKCYSCPAALAALIDLGSIGTS